MLTLTAGLFQLGFGYLDLFNLDPNYHVLQISVGVLGVLMAWRLHLARMYGLLLLLSFGTLAFLLNDISTESFLGVRTALIGLFITLARPAKAAQR
ncbi:hypothetical protein BBK82_06480 [Lentzea guizhouensis]|uniref:Uncharacterized protein n=1 Tax=Lentzea guizhouensis TaxID=1586287 RepID=A0A1B2HDK3_9PSEU|nr:hypothetical protein [Lentzea guizhouensis]ANZ35783.1 hypothetical protein BBK82_06480 [Lentzea guizhouensis]